MSETLLVPKTIVEMKSARPSAPPSPSSRSWRQPPRPGSPTRRPYAS